MQGANGSSQNHRTAWNWLTNESQADVCLLQEVVPDDEFLRHWSDFYFVKKYADKNWGSMILVRQGSLEKFEPTSETPWLKRFQGSAPLAKHNDSGFMLCSVHSNAEPVQIDEDELPETLLRCNKTKVWEIELTSHDLAPMLQGQKFIVGGDLNSSLGFDKNYNRQNNARLFGNLKDCGFNDTRLKFFDQEQSTYFKQGQAPYQLDHVYSDSQTYDQVQSWEVLTQLVTVQGLSDHAPIGIKMGAKSSCWRAVIEATS